MRHPLIWVLVTLTFIACRYGEIMPMPGGGAPYKDGDSGSGGVTPSGDDTGAPPITDDTGPPSGAGDAPTILAVTTSVEEYPDIGWVAEITITYTDPDFDVDGGTVLINVSITDAEPEEVTFPIDGSSAIHDADDGTVFMAFSVPGSSVSGTMMVFLDDANGHRSEPFETSFD